MNHIFSQIICWNFSCKIIITICYEIGEGGRDGDKEKQVFCSPTLRLWSLPLGLLLETSVEQDAVISWKFLLGSREIIISHFFPPLKFWIELIRKLKIKNQEKEQILYLTIHIHKKKPSVTLRCSQNYQQAETGRESECWNTIPKLFDNLTNVLHGKLKVGNLIDHLVLVFVSS